MGRLQANPYNSRTQPKGRGLRYDWHRRHTRRGRSQWLRIAAYGCCLLCLFILVTLFSQSLSSATRSQQTPLLEQTIRNRKIQKHSETRTLSGDLQRLQNFPKLQPGEHLTYTQEDVDAFLKTKPHSTKDILLAAAAKGDTPPLNNNNEPELVQHPERLDQYQLQERPEHDVLRDDPERPHSYRQGGNGFSGRKLEPYPFPKQETEFQKLQPPPASLPDETEETTTLTSLRGGSRSNREPPSVEHTTNVGGNGRLGEPMLEQEEEIRDPIPHTTDQTTVVINVNDGKKKPHNDTGSGNPHTGAKEKLPATTTDPKPEDDRPKVPKEKKLPEANRTNVMEPLETLKLLEHVDEKEEEVEQKDKNNESSEHGPLVLLDQAARMAKAERKEKLDDTQNIDPPSRKDGNDEKPKDPKEKVSAIDEPPKTDPVASETVPQSPATEKATADAVPNQSQPAPAKPAFELKLEAKEQTPKQKETPDNAKVEPKVPAEIENEPAQPEPAQPDHTTETKAVSDKATVVASATEERAESTTEQDGAKAEPEAKETDAEKAADTHPAEPKGDTVESVEEIQPNEERKNEANEPKQKQKGEPKLNVEPMKNDTTTTADAPIQGKSEPADERKPVEQKEETAFTVDDPPKKNIENVHNAADTGKQKITAPNAGENVATTDNPPKQPLDANDDKKPKQDTVPTEKKPSETENKDETVNKPPVVVKVNDTAVATDRKLQS